MNSPTLKSTNMIALAERTSIVRRGRRLQYLTIAWNSAECAVALLAGFWAGSIALIGWEGLEAIRGRTCCVH